MALGRLQQALQHTPLHQAWLWRETARAAAKISQNAGYRVSYDQLVQDLAGLPIERAGDGSGPAAAKRIFLTAARLFRATGPADRITPSSELFHPLWSGGGATRTPDEARTAGAASTSVLDQIKSLAESLVRGAAGAVPLLSLLQGLRDNRMRGLSPTLARLTLPLAIHQAGLVPKVVPTLLGGRLPALGSVLATASSLPETGALTLWLVRALTGLAKEADGARRRLQDLTTQHRAWHDLVAASGPRRHSRVPAVLDLLAVTPVISASLVARHLGCTPQGAGLILGQLTDLGVLTMATRRSRWKIFLAADLAIADRDGLGADGPLLTGRILPQVDHEAIEQTLDSLLLDLDRAVDKTKVSLAAATSGARAGG